jgi:hypothetical protein
MPIAVKKLLEFLQNFSFARNSSQKSKMRSILQNFFRNQPGFARSLSLVLFVFCIALFPAFSDESENVIRLPFYNTARVTAAGKALLSNFTLSSAVRLQGAEFVNVTGETIQRNLQLSSWRWETGDRFHVNQIGHPYQGSTYFNSSRSNGLGFYPSILFSSFGSYTWEVFLKAAGRL